MAAGLDARRVTGQRAYDEGKTAVLAGAAAGAGILLSQGTAVFALASTWIWGIALPMTVAGVATHYLAYLRTSWTQFWQQRERDRSAPIFLVLNMYDVRASAVRLMHKQDLVFFALAYLGHCSVHDSARHCHALPGTPAHCHNAAVAARAGRQAHTLSVQKPMHAPKQGVHIQGSWRMTDISSAAPYSQRTHPRKSTGHCLAVRQI